MRHRLDAKRDAAARQRREGGTGVLSGEESALEFTRAGDKRFRDERGARAAVGQQEVSRFFSDQDFNEMHRELRKGKR